MAGEFVLLAGVSGRFRCNKVAANDLSPNHLPTPLVQLTHERLEHLVFGVAATGVDRIKLAYCYFGRGNV
jgi:hypothetical protein